MLCTRGVPPCPAPCRELQERHAQRANGAADGDLSSPHRLGSLDREGYAGPMGSVELEAGPAVYGEAQAEAHMRRHQQQHRLLAGHANSSAYDAGED